MLKLTYLLSLLIAASLISCKKKVVYPSPTTTNNTVTKDTLSGKIFTIAGNGYGTAQTGGFSGDGGQATAAELDAPWGVTVDVSGNVYIADLYNERIRKINTSGVILTIAGSGVRGYSGDGGAATAAEFYYPQAIAVDGLGNIYISDNGNQCIRKVNAGGIVSTFAGNGYKVGAGGGYSGDGGAATSAEISLPYGLAVDYSGNVFITDMGNGRIRMVNLSGIISTVAGSGSGKYSGDGGLATAVGMDPQGVAVDASGNIYIADYENNRIRKVNTSGIISTIAGNGFEAPFSGGYSGDGGQGTSAEIFYPTDVKVDGSGNVYIDDAYNERIRMVNSNGIISTIAGIGFFTSYDYSGDGGPATAAETGYSQGMALDASGNIYIADLYVERIRKVYK